MRRYREPEDLFPLVGVARRVRAHADDIDVSRARWIELLLRNPAAAKRERLEARLAYWRGRVEALEKRLREADAALQDALEPTENEEGKPAPAPSSVIHELRVERTVAWADVQAAKAELRRIEAELAGA